MKHATVPALIQFTFVDRMKLKAYLASDRFCPGSVISAPFTSFNWFKVYFGRFADIHSSKSFPDVCIGGALLAEYDVHWETVKI